MRLIACTAFVAASALSLASCGDGSSPSGPAAPAAGQRKGGFLASLPLQPVDGKVSFGSVSPCGPALERTVKVRNQSDAPVEVKAYASNCACVEAKLVGGRTIGPGEERDLLLTVRPSGHGDRSVSVEFGGNGGMLGSVRVDYSLGKGVVALPSALEVHDDGRDAVEDVEVLAGDMKEIRILRMDPSVGSVEVAAGARCKASVSMFEARRFAESPEGAGHPGVRRDASGRVTGLTVTFVTDYGECPDAKLDISFAR